MKTIDLLTVKARHDRHKVMDAVNQSFENIDELLIGLRRQLAPAFAAAYGGVGTNGRNKRVA